MPQYSENESLNSPAVDKLLTLVEEVTRATKDSPRRFIEPARGTLDRAKSRRHHIVFGRRGSGKTSLLRKAGADLTLGRVPSAFIDLETFKSHAYPDVLLSVLIQTMRAFDTWLGTAGLSPGTKTSFWKKIWGGKPERPPLNRTLVQEVREAVQAQVTALENLLHTDDEATITARSFKNQKETSTETQSMKVGVAPSVLAVSAEDSSAGGIQHEEAQELTEVGKRNKIEYLHRHIIDFQRVFEQMTEVSATDAYIFLDDLYHIRRSDQAKVLDYFHRIAKGRSVWLKVGTIRHRTDWYHHGDPPVGLKLGDDCDAIDLDITLEKFGLAKRFLLQVLDQLIAEVGIPDHTRLLTTGGIERLLLASGGVARDFLTIFRRSIDVARERGTTHRGDRIGAEDVNVAAGEHDVAKRDELERDADDERLALEHALHSIQEFCVQNNVNCFLIEQEAARDGREILGELADLRFVHVVDSRTTVRDMPGKLFTTYMLDVSQYTGERRRRELEMIRFWVRAELDRIRSSKYVLDPKDFAREKD